MQRRLNCLTPHRLASWLTLLVAVLLAVLVTGLQPAAAQGAAPAALPQPGPAVDVAVGRPGEGVLVDRAGALWRRDPARGAWVPVAQGMAPTARVARVAIGNDGTVWALDAEGRVMRQDGAAWRTEAVEGVDLAATPNGGVIVATRDGELARYDSTQRRWSRSPGAATRVAVDARGVVWIVGAQGAVMRASGTAPAAWVGVNAQATDIAADIGPGGSDRVVIAGLDQRAYAWTEATGRWEPLPQARSVAAVALGAGGLWQLSPEGLVWGDGLADALTPTLPPSMPPAARPTVPTRWVRLDVPAVQVAVAASADVFALDPSGSAWQLRAADVQAERFTNWSRLPGRFAQLRATPDGRLWALDRDGGLWLWDGTVWRPAAERVRDVAAAPDGSAWLLRGNAIVAAATNAALQPPPPAAAGPVQALQADAHGLLWTTHADGRVERFDGTAWVTQAGPPRGLASVALGVDGTVFGLSPEGALLRRDALAGGWQAHAPPSSVPLATAAVGPDGLPWVLNARGELWAERPLARTAAEPPLPALFTRLLTWRPVGGGAVARVSVASDGGVLALAPDGAVWRWQGGTTWASVSGRLAAVAAAPANAAWGLSLDGRVLRLQGGFWNELPLPGSARFITSAPQGALWVLSTDDQIVRWDEPGRRWVLQARALPRTQALAVGAEGELWVIDEAGTVRLLRGSDWVPVPGIVARSLSLGPEGTVYASAADEALHWLDRREMAWKPASGRVLQVAVGPGGSPWAVFPGNRLMASGRFLDEQADLLAKREAGRVAPPTPPVLVVTPGVPPSLTLPLNYQLLASDMRVQDIGVGADGSVFAVGGDGSLQCFSAPDRRFVSISPGQNLRVAVAGDGSPWVQAANGAITRFERGQWRTVPEFSGRDLAVGPDGTVWAVGSDGAAFRYLPAAGRFDRQAITRSDAPVKGRRIAGAQRGVYWVASEDNTLFQCQNGDCQTRLIGVADVAVAPDNTVFALDLLGNLRRYNESRREFVRVNGSGANLAVGPFGLPWLVAADGRVSTAASLTAPARGINTAQCAARLNGAPVPTPASPGGSVAAADDNLLLPAGLSVSLALLLENDGMGGVRPTLRDAALSLESLDGLLRVDGEVLQVDPSARVGAVLSASYRLCSRTVVGSCAAARVRVTVAPVQTVPGAPQQVLATAGAAQASVAFVPPASDGGAPITRYTVVSSPDGLSASGSGSPLVVGGLRNGVAYTFTVTASNALGSGPASPPSNAVTPQAAATVPGPPTAVVAVAGNAAATVSFAAPASDGGLPVQRYTVTASPGGATASGAASPLVVSGLSNGTAYTFTVTASNALGSSVPSAPSNPVTPEAAATVPAAPTAVTAVAGNAQATVSFAAPLTDGGRPVLGYTVTASPGGATASGAASPLTVAGLSNGTAYSFTVVARNAVGNSLPSSPSAAVTPATVPAAPTAVTAVAGNAAATVSFAPPASDGGLPVQRYTVTSSPGGISATGAASPLTVAGLSNGTAYSFTVTASNAAGSSVPSAPSNPVTPEAAATVPAAPTAVAAVAGNSQATVSFAAPVSDGGRPVLGYTVTASPGGATASGTASPLTVAGLSNGTAYSFTVVARNALGNSLPSSPSAAVTPATVPGAPGAVVATPGNAQLSVGFAAPAESGGAPITGYTVTASPGGASVSGAASPLVLGGLSNGVAYTVTVTARNAVGVGPASAPSAASTPSGAPGAPGAVVAVAGNASARVSFTAPSSDGGAAITGYTVTASPGGATATGGASPVTVAGLSNGTAYTFTVVARNANGAGPASAPSAPVVPVAPATVPGAPTGVTDELQTTSEVQVNFVAPSDTGGSPITGYRVVAAPADPALEVIRSGPTQFRVRGLNFTTAYTFRVVAINAVGESPASAPTAVVNPSTRPLFPPTVSATPGDGAITVTLGVPTSNGGSAITSYTVLVYPVGSIAENGRRVSAAGNEIRVTGLTNGVAYCYYGWASNANGRGATSPACPAGGTTPGAAPGAPTGVSALSGNGVASVAFSPPAAVGGSPLTGYTVTASPGGASASGTASPLVVSGLSNGTAYTFTVRAANASGLGAPSLVSNAVTPAVAPGAVAILNWGIFNRDARQVHVFFNAADPGGPSLPDNPVGILDYTARAYNAATEVVDTVTAASPPVTNITATGRAQYLQLTLPFDPCEVHRATATLRLTVVARSATGMGPLLYFNAGRALFGASQCP